MFRRISVSFAIFLLAGNVAAANIGYNLSPGDKALLFKAVAYSEKKDFEKAKKEASHASDKDILDVILWLQYQEQNSNNNYSEISDFIRKHPNWPRIKRLKNIAEATLDSKLPAKQIVDYFKEELPITGHAMRLLAEAKMELGLGGDKEIKALIRQAWIQGDFNHDDEEYFLRKHRKILRQEDHLNRIDRLLWEHKISVAKRLIGRVGHSHRSLFAARIKLIQSQRGVDSAVNRVAKTLVGDPGFLYERIRWHQRRKNYSRAYDYIKDVKTQMPYQEKWWKVKNFLIRELLEEKKYTSAYNLAKNHGNSPGGADYAEAEWLAGWISLDFLNKPRTAYEHFYQLYSNVNYPVSLARGAYWSGRAAEKNENTDIANKWYHVASKHPTTFYGQLAHMRIKKDEKPQLPEFPKLSYNKMPEIRNNDLLKVAYLLSVVGKNKLAEKFIIEAIRSADSESEMAAISEFGNQVKRTELSVVAAKHALRKEVILSKTGWPIIEIPDSQVEAPLVLGIIRQESSFNTEARSPARASGLMQIIPSTAKNMSGRLKMKYDRNALTKNPTYNMTLGSNYLGNLINRFDGSYILAIAAYNAGPTNVRRWIKTYGDPRELKDGDSIIGWIEGIPFAETRNYVQRVLENTQIYRYLISGKPFALESDLSRLNTELARE